ncbi:MAG: hypothetical protein JW874_10360 [Spirochaetales bacterium]|nr:hypothetical protein [Spirochaetales bacterium]
MKAKPIIIFLCVFVAFSSFADVTVEMVDQTRNIMRAVYTFEETNEGAVNETFPNNGFTFNTGDIRVISVKELNTGKNLDYEIIKKGGKQSVKINYADPLPKGANYRIECIIEATTGNFKKVSAGIYELSFFTGYDAYFVLPKDHALIYSNLPVLLYEKDGRIMVLVKADEFFPHKIVLKTKDYSK